MFEVAAQSSGRLRLLFLTDCSLETSGGSERFLRNLINHLPRDQCAISVVQLCGRPPATERTHAAELPSHVELSYLPCGPVYGRAGIRALCALRGRLQREGFHVIQSQHETADILNACLPRGKLNAQRISNRRDMGFLKSSRLRRLSRILAGRYDRIVAPSRAILEQVACSEGASTDAMSCIPNGVDTTIFLPASDQVRSAARAALGIDTDAPLLGCVADLFEVKRHIDLIDAFATVRQALPAARLLLVGDGPMRATIEARVSQLQLEGSVTLAGTRADVAALVPSLDLFVLASDSEGLSNAILEAQACGLPVVATKVGGNPDLVNDDCGVLVPARNPAAMAAAILDLLRNPARRTQMGVAAHEHVRNNHSLERMAQSYLALYRDAQQPH